MVKLNLFTNKHSSNGCPTILQQVVGIRKAQQDYNKLASTRNRTFKAQYEEVIDNEIQRVGNIKTEKTKQQQLL